jgi:hypothetical protein
MIKYRITHDNQMIEFATREEAENYLQNNSITSEIETVEEVVQAKATVPQTVTPRQIRIALVMSGISLSTIEAMIDNLPEPDRSITKITWEYSVEFQRNNPLLNAIAPIFGFTQQQIDELFQLASTL